MQNCTLKNSRSSITTTLVIAADIFGCTPALEEITSRLKNGYAVAIIVDPYRGGLHEFADEQEAYTFFTYSCGLNRYKEILSETLSAVSAPVTLISFSVGASAIWSIVGDERFAPGSRAVCFYGSQIRAMPDVQPTLPTELIFPSVEPHFSVSELMDTVCGKAAVHCTRTIYQHGFMNRRSVNFDVKGYREYMQRLQQLRDEIT